MRKAAGCATWLYYVLTFCALLILIDSFNSISARCLESKVNDLSGQNKCRNDIRSKQKCEKCADIIEANTRDNYIGQTSWPRDEPVTSEFLQNASFTHPVPIRCLVITKRWESFRNDTKETIFTERNYFCITNCVWFKQLSHQCVANDWLAVVRKLTTLNSLHAFILRKVKCVRYVTGSIDFLFDQINMLCISCGLLYYTRTTQNDKINPTNGRKILKDYLQKCSQIWFVFEANSKFTIRQVNYVVNVRLKRWTNERWDQRRRVIIINNQACGEQKNDHNSTGKHSRCVFNALLTQCTECCDKRWARLLLIFMRHQSIFPISNPSHNQAYNNDRHD